jgi:hypothetical protein
MEAIVAYLISVGLTAFGLAVVAVGVKIAGGWLLVWVAAGLIPVVVGVLSLFNEARRNGREQY